MQKHLAIRQNRDKLITSFEQLASSLIEQKVENFKEEMIRWYGSSIEIVEEFEGYAKIYKVTNEGLFLESLCIIEQKKD